MLNEADPRQLSSERKIAWVHTKRDYLIEKHIYSEICGQIKHVATLIHNEIADLQVEVNRQPEKRDSEHSIRQV